MEADIARNYEEPLTDMFFPGMAGLERGYNKKFTNADVRKVARVSQEGGYGYTSVIFIFFCFP